MFILQTILMVGAIIGFSFSACAQAIRCIRLKTAHHVSLVAWCFLMTGSYSVLGLMLLTGAHEMLLISQFLSAFFGTITLGIIIYFKVKGRRAVRRIHQRILNQIHESGNDNASNT